MNVYTNKEDDRYWAEVEANDRTLYTTAFHDTEEDAAADAQRWAAKHLFVVYTGGTGRIDGLYGPQKASCRAHILSAFTGKNVPKSKAAWGVFRDAMNELFGVSGDCTADRQANLRVEALNWEDAQ